MARKAATSTKKTQTKRAIKPPQRPVRRTTEPGKPIIQTGTLVTIVLFAAVILFAVYLNRQKKTEAAQATPTSGTTFVFNKADGNPSSIEVKPAGGDSVKVARDAKNAWVLFLPQQTEADQGSAEAAASQVTALAVVSPVTGDPSIFGFDKPAFVITIEFAGGKKHTLEVGDPTPTQSGYYVRLDKGSMMIVSTNGIDALTSMVKTPPYLNTPTPSPLPPTETPIPPTGTATTPASLETTVTPTP